MIVVDIETSGMNFLKCGIWQIGAVDITTNEEFIQESRIDDEDSIEPAALLIIRKTEEYLRNKKKQSQQQLLESFFSWINKRKVKTFICQNPQFDSAFINIKAKKYNLEIPFHYRAIDLHTLAQTIYYQKNNSFLMEQNHSEMNLSKIMELCGMQDNRIMLENEKVTKQGKPHNALEDARIEAECFKKLLKIKT